jgi:hypothetical protein
MEGPARRTLLRALEIVGTKERLAEALTTSVPDLEIYLGDGDVPERVFFKALDVVANAPRLKKRFGTES